MHKEPDFISTEPYKTKVYWIKDAFSLNHSFFRNKERIGFIRDNSLNRSVETSIFGNDYFYEADGFLRTHLDIIDMQRKEQIGGIKFHLFSAKARVFLNDNTYLWSLDNLMGTKWILKNDQDEIILSASNKKEGYCNIPDPETGILLLTSIVIRNQCSKQGY